MTNSYRLRVERFFACVLLLFIACFTQESFADTGSGTVSLSVNGAPVTEDFNSLSNSAGSTMNTTLPTGWYITEQGGGTRDNEQYAVDTGASATGDTYSYGSTPTTDRALGGLQSGNLIPFFGAKFQNNTGATITSLQISYAGEEWRLGATGRTDRLDFQISTNATSLTIGTYSDVDALDFITPDTGGTAGAKNGNALPDRAIITSTISPLAISNGATFYIRWTDADISGSEDGLAVDDFSITPQTGPVTAALSINDVTQAETNAGSTTFTFTVSLNSPALAGGVTFDIATADGSAQDDVPATEDNDYVAKSETGRTIPENGTTAIFTVTVNGDTLTEPNETFFVNVTNVSGAIAGDTQGVGTIVNDDTGALPIHDIQGNGSTSPMANQVVTTSGVVTGVKTSGFFIQTPEAFVDANSDTSEGVFVFTSSAPPASAVIGNLVNVTGTVSEFVPGSDPDSPPMTEITGPSVSLVSTGNPLPTPVVITASETTQPSETSDPLDSLEEYEGMRVTVASLTVCGPSQGTITEPSATVTSSGIFHGVVTGVARPFRTQGIAISDPLPAGAPGTIPRFDENPERIRVDSDGLVGGSALDVAAGTVLTNVTGPLDYGFRCYTIDPESPPVVGTQPGSVPAPTPTANEFTVASFNMERFFDTVNDPSTSDPVLTAAAFNRRLAKASLIVRTVQRYPDVIGVEEMENLTTLQAVASKINSDAVSIDALPNPNYTAYLVEGNDIGGIDVGFLVKQSRISVINVTQYGLTDTITNPDSSTSILNDRPPLLLRASCPRPGGGSQAFTVIVNHMRSLNGIDDNGPGSSGYPTEGDRIRFKRRAQAEYLANLIQARQVSDPTELIITLGDLNAFNVNDGYVDSIGTIKGTPAAASAVTLASADLVNPDQTNLIDLLSPDQQYSYNFDGNAQTLDHVIVSPPALALLTRFVHARDDSDFAVKNYESTNDLRISDHDQPIAYFLLTASSPTPSPTAAPTATPAPTASPSPTPATPTPPPTFVAISGSVDYCSSPTLNPVPGVTLTLTGSSSATMLSDGSGNYVFTGLPFAGVFTVTPTKSALPPGATGINTVDVLAAQRHFLGVVTIPAGCRLTAADVNGDTAINTVDVIAIQRFFLGLSTGTANVGKYRFAPASRSYPGVFSDQNAQNYDTLVFGDVASGFVH